MTMTCKNDDIKLLLSDYLSRRLDQQEQARVRTHLDSCEDCRAELSLLRMMADEAVPDPGEAFWSEMPGQVRRAVQQQDKKSASRSFSDLFRGLALPRWAWATATVGIIVAVSWLIMHQTPQGNIVPAIPEEEYASQDASQHDPVLRHTSATIAELTPVELDAADSWAAKELSSLAAEAGANTTNIFDTDLNEELAELDAHEVDRLSTMLKELDEKEEGRS